MRTGILLAMALLPAAAAPTENASITTGAFELLGGASANVSHGSTKVKEDQAGSTEVKTTSDEYGLDLAGFYYLAPNLGLGLSASYAMESEDSEGVPRPSGGTMSTFSRSRIWTIGPAICGQVPVAASLALFARGSAEYAFAKIWGTDTPALKATGYALAFGAGVKYFPVAQVSINAGVNYVYLELTQDAVEDPTFGSIPKTTASGWDLSVSAGFSVYFGR